jgi:hypothetical protein
MLAPRLDATDAVDVPRHQVASQRVPHAQGALEVHAIPGAQAVEGRDPKGLRADIGLEAARPPPDHGQTDAVDRDAGAEGQLAHLQAGRDRDAPGAARERAQGLYLSDAFDDAGEHVASIL